MTSLAGTHRIAAAALRARRSHTFKAFYATIRSLRERPQLESDEPDLSSENDFIVSILRANPSLRDTKSYLQSFGIRPQSTQRKDPATPSLPPFLNIPPPSIQKEELQPVAQVDAALNHPQPSPIVSEILNPIHRRTALVKIQGPFTDVQLDSIARGIVYLEKLGLVSVIIVENDKLVRGDEGERNAVVEETMRVVSALEKQGANARPVLGAVVRLGPHPKDDASQEPRDFVPPEAHVFPSDLVPIRSALRAGEIPVLPPFALDSFCRSVRIDANDVISALARGMVEAGNSEIRDDVSPSTKSAPHPPLPKADHEHVQQVNGDVDLTPLRLMIINREGGVPSYARSGYPHLLINLTSEFPHIHDTFDPSWRETKPTALSNLSLARTCLAYMPPTSSAVMVSHRSPSSLIANLITNKPAVSSSLPHALLQGNRKLTPHTPTLIRRGLDVRVIKDLREVDKTKMKFLLETSFNKTLDEDAFYKRLEKNLDFIIVAGDYAGAAIVTNEPSPMVSSSPGSPLPISYLDKFAVLPNHQGSGTVDFLWVALHDESYGLGLSFAVNPNGGKEGRGEGRDLVWRSRADNPVNKWYFERSTGHLRMGKWIVFWCDAEKRLSHETLKRVEREEALSGEGRVRKVPGLSYVEGWERGRLSVWADVVTKIPSSWK